MIVNVFYVKET